MMGTAGAILLVGDATEVDDVLRDDRPRLCLRVHEQRTVVKAAQVRSGGDRIDIMAPASELLGDGLRVHLVE